MSGSSSMRLGSLNPHSPIAYPPAAHANRSTASADGIELRRMPSSPATGRPASPRAGQVPATPATVIAADSTSGDISTTQQPAPAAPSMAYQLPEANVSGDTLVEPAGCNMDGLAEAVTVVTSTLTGALAGISIGRGMLHEPNGTVGVGFAATGALCCGVLTLYAMSRQALVTGRQRAGNVLGPVISATGGGLLATGATLVSNSILSTRAVASTASGVFLTAAPLFVRYAPRGWTSSSAPDPEAAPVAPVAIPAAVTAPVTADA